MSEGKSPVTVRLARPEDLGRLAEIERESMARPWTAQQLAAEFENEFAYLLCAETGGELAGVCDIHIAYGGAHINELSVAPKHRRKGVASALVAEAERAARHHGCGAITLEVRASGREARAFYDALGFTMIGQKWGFYRDPVDDALVLKKEFSEE